MFVIEHTLELAALKSVLSDFRTHSLSLVVE